MIQCGMDVAKAEAKKDAAGKWRVARVQNEEHRQQGVIDWILEQVAVLGHLQVSAGVHFRILELTQGAAAR